MEVPLELPIGSMSHCFQKVVSIQAVLGDSDRMPNVAFPEFSTLILLQVGTKNVQIGAWLYCPSSGGKGGTVSPGTLRRRGALRRINHLGRRGFMEFGELLKLNP